MIGANTTITTYRLSTANNKESYSETPTLNGVPVYIALMRLETAVHIDQQNALKMYRLESDEDLNIQVGDKVVDGQASPATYRVHTILSEPRTDGIGNQTACILVKKT